MILVQGFILATLTCVNVMARTEGWWQVLSSVSFPISFCVFVWLLDALSGDDYDDYADEADDVDD